MNLFTKTFLLWAGLAVSVVGSGCDGVTQGKMRGSVIKTIPSPENNARILITKDGGNATVSYAYRVYLLRGMDEDSASLLMHADSTDGVDARWISPSNIEISMFCGRIFEYTNFGDLINENGELVSRIEVKQNATPLCEQEATE